MPRTIAIAWLSVVLAAACESNGPGWPGAPATADPAPTGEPGLRAYKEGYYKALGSQLVEALTQDQVVRLCLATRVIWLGDHHADPELHARQRALLQHLVREHGLRPVLLLEAIGVEDEPAVQSYAFGQLDRTSMRRLVKERWPQSWLDAQDVDGPHYQALLDLAREFKLPVHGIEPVPRGPLERRDPTIARVVARAAQRYEGRTLVVHVGSAHLLGSGDLVARVGLPSIAFGAVLSAPLERKARDEPFRGADFVRSSSGVVFFGSRG